MKLKSTLLFCITCLICFNLIAEDSDAEANLKSGSIYYKSENYMQAFHYFELASDKGDAVAQYYLGVMYSNGDGVSVDKKLAFKYFKLAADQGDLDAQYNLGLLYYYGDGVAVDKKLAFNYYKLAADQGVYQAQHHLGRMYYYGEGVLKDYKQAASYIEKAYNNGHEESASFWEEYELWKYKE